jgi:hypothetical protein
MVFVTAFLGRGVRKEGWDGLGWDSIDDDDHLWRGKIDE